MKEIGQELFQTRNHKDSLKDIDLSLSFKKAASCGDNCIKIHDLTDMKEVYSIITIDDAGGQLDKMEWTEDGQLLAISTEKGSYFSFSRIFEYIRIYSQGFLYAVKIIFYSLKVTIVKNWNQTDIFWIQSRLTLVYYFKF